MSKKYNQPKVTQSPSDKHLRTQYQPSGNRANVRENPGSTDGETPAWQFHLCDKEHERWGWKKLKHDEFVEIISHLESFEKMNWFQIKQASGGKSKGTNNHFVPVDACISDAKKRLQQLKKDDVDELFSLRLMGKLRLYGIKQGRVLQFLWCDPEHSICPSAKKHT